jgi:cephalosporin hydroxylase
MTTDGNGHRQRSLHWYRENPQPFEFCPSADFFALADAVVQERRTLLKHERLYVLWQAVHNVAAVGGAAVEIGAYQGGSAFFIASTFIRAVGDEVPMHVFDTFRGHPAQSMTEHDPFQIPGDFSKTSYERVRTYLARFQRLRVHQGDILDLIPALDETTYRFVHIDTDLYQPTIACLRYFGTRTAAGGVIVVDDYGADKCPGVTRAVCEYLADTPGVHAWDTRTEQLLLTVH